MKYNYRVTKYDPQYRDAHGVYTRDEWYLFTQVGQTFEDGTLSLEEYERVESNYIRVALQFMEEAGVTRLQALDVQADPADGPAEGQFLPIAAIGNQLRGMLREQCWFRLEEGPTYIHIGWDFYMYIGVPVRCAWTKEAALQAGLFVEDMASPYAMCTDDEAL